MGRRVVLVVVAGLPRGPLAFLLLLFLLLSLGGCHGLSFQLPPQARKCLKEELHRDVMVTGEYDVSEAAAPGIRTDLRVTDSSGSLRYSEGDAKKGKLTLIPEDDDAFEVCFQSHGQPGNSQVPDQLVTLSIKRGAEARNYEEVAKMERLVSLEVGLRRVEDLSASIAKDFASAKRREEATRGAGESLRVHVFHLSLFSTLCLVALAVWQVFRLPRLVTNPRAHA